VADHFFDNRPYRDIKNLAQLRQKARMLEDGAMRSLATQLLRYGVCPCMAMGRYSTCCQKKHGPITHQ
jgi:hypothetical protein